MRCAQLRRSERCFYLLELEPRVVEDGAVAADFGAGCAGARLGEYVCRGVPSSLMMQSPVDESTVRSMHA